MQSHSAGPILGARIGALVTAQTFQVDRTRLVTAANNKLFTIEASTTNPVAYRTRLVVETAETTTGASALSVGTASGGTQILNAVDLKSTAGTNLVPTNNVRVATADTDIWAVATRADTNGAGGLAFLIIELFDINTVASSTVE